MRDIVIGIIVILAVSYWSWRMAHMWDDKPAKPTKEEKKAKK